MAKDEGKNLGYHWRRAAGIYDKPGRATKGNDSTTTETLSGLTGKTKASAKKK